MFDSYDRFASPSVMSKELGWEPLIERSAKVKSITAYKTLNQLIDNPGERFSQSNIYHTRNQTTLQVLYCHTEICKCSYFPSAAKLWNIVLVYIREKLH